MIERIETLSIAVLCGLLSIAGLMLYDARTNLRAALAERDTAVAQFAQFRARTQAEASRQQAESAAEAARLEKLTDDTRTAYNVALDRLRALHAADRLRRAAQDRIRAGGGGVPEAPADPGRADAAAADAGPDPGGASSSTLIDRCAETTLRCAWLQHLVRQMTEKTAP